jgi:hypothetical protein|tara:strand:+ start:1147 stop:1725 length:579 start_codon:yes stop_codon:yes gene_type:complete
MSKETLLKKDFKESDVQRIRNIVNKDFTSGTKIQSGYRKSSKKHKEGDIWEEGGKQWTIIDGIKQNITKLDAAKKALRMPLCCPKCGGPLEHWMSKKMYKIHGFCFDPCTVEFEAELRKAGLYKEYEKKMITGNIKEFISDIESWVLNSINDKSSFVTEAGDIEDWGGMSNKAKKKILQDLKDYTNRIRKQL